MDATLPRGEIGNVKSTTRITRITTLHNNCDEKKEKSEML
jgi:hypothetical protein